MTRLPTIEIHGTDKNGTPYVLNHMSSDNAAVQGSNTAYAERALAKLRDMAAGFVMKCQKYLPDDVIKVVEL